MASLRMLAACTRGCRAPGQSLHRDFAAGSRCGPCGSAHGANRRGETPQRERIRGGAERLEDSMIRRASLQRLLAVASAGYRVAQLHRLACSRACKPGQSHWPSQTRRPVCCGVGIGVAFQRLKHALDCRSMKLHMGVQTRSKLLNEGARAAAWRRFV